MSFNNVLFEYVEQDVIKLIASTGYILVTATINHPGIAPFEPFMVHKDHIKSITSDCTVMVIGDELIFMCTDGNVIACGKEKGEYPNYLRAMAQRCKEKPTPQEMDGGFMKTVIDTAAEVSNDLHLSPGNSKEAFIIKSANCTFAIMPRG
jgi:hypothetical protein